MALVRLWQGLSLRRRAHVMALMALMAITIGCQLVFIDWYIEDAAISFAFARNLANGEGLVAWPGGERVEGYSNPTWVALMALWQLFGIDGFISSKLMGAVFGAATLPFTWAIARHLRPDRDDEVPLVAAAALAASAQFVIWDASGLENSVCSLLMAAGTWRVLVERRPGTWPVSAVLFFLLAVSRPEAILYGAGAGFWAMVFAFADGRGLRPTLAWLAAFFVPWTTYQLAHLEYFAWPLPNTYYAKTDANDFQPLSWNSRCWKYVRNWAWDLGQDGLLPVYVLGLLGAVGWRRNLGVVALGLLGLAVSFTIVRGGTIDRVVPDLFNVVDGWIAFRVGTIAVVAFALPLFAIGRPGWRALVLCWHLVALALLFTLWSGGDWMKQYRFMSMLAVPLSVLLAAGAGEIGDALQWSLGRVWRESRWTIPGAFGAIAVLAAAVTPDVMAMQSFARKPETGPYSVQKRVNYMNWAKRRLHIDGPVRNLDVDEGAHLWWSGHQMYDIAGLIDLPMGHHNYEKPFIKEYLFEEVKPHFAHVHGGWASTSKIPTHPEWKRDYIEIPGYPSSATALHVGNNIRKDLLIDQGWTGTPGRRVEMEDGVVLEGWEAPSDRAGQEMYWYVEVGLSSRVRGKDKDDFRVLAFVADADGHVQSWAIPPGYDWYETSEWQPGEVFHGRFSLHVPRDLPPGTYDLGFVFLGADGHVLGPAGDRPEGVAGGEDPRMARGEVRFPNVLTVVSHGALEELAEGDVRSAVDAAEETRCEEAEAAWTLARDRETWVDRWLDAHAPIVEPRLARCWATRAQNADRDDQIAWIIRGRRWNHDDPLLLKVAGPLADALIAEGRAASDSQDWETAYRRYSDALKVDPTRSWARRWAEDARDHRLGLDAVSIANKALADAAAREERKKKTPPKPKAAIPDEGPEEDVAPGHPDEP